MLIDLRNLGIPGKKLARRSTGPASSQLQHVPGDTAPPFNPSACASARRP